MTSTDRAVQKLAPVRHDVRLNPIHKFAHRFVYGCLAALMTLVLFAGSASASSSTPLVWARAGDALTLDPHAVNEGATHALNHQIYEPLLVRDRAGKIEPALAASWTQSINPLIWVFTLRPNVRFHNGQPLTADDVIFSLNRAKSPTSDLRTRLASVKSFKATAPDTIEIVTYVRDALLPIRLTDIFVMSRSWAEEKDVVQPQNYQAGEITYAATNANGTGPYKLVSREPDTATRLTRNDAYWGWNPKELNNRIRDVIYQTIPNHSERVTSLLDGSVDFVQDVPLNDLEVLRQAPGLSLKTGPENRVIFLGLSIRPQHDGKPNPLADDRVREALENAIDRSGIQRKIMLGQSIPTAVLAPPGINGFPFDLDQIPPRDLAKARGLLKSAAVQEGTALQLDCPSNRYVNDAQICKAVAEQFAEIGITVKTNLRAKAEHFQHVRTGKSQLYLMGWGVPTFDSAYIFSNLVHSRTAVAGTWNGTGFTDPAVDQQIKALSQLTVSGDRSRSMATIWQTIAAKRIYLPIHVQTLMYAMRAGIDIDVDISNAPKLKDVFLTGAYASETPQPIEAGTGNNQSK